MSLFKIFDIAGSGLRAQNIRLNLTASNLANTDAIATSKDDAYRARHPVFKTLLEHQSGSNPIPVGVETIDIVESQVEPVRSYQPGNPLADSEGYIYSSNVNSMEEMTNMISATRSYQTNVEIMDASKKLLQETLKLGQ